MRVTKSSHHKHSDETVRVELTARGPREVVRAEADADDKQVAFERALRYEFLLRTLSG